MRAELASLGVTAPVLLAPMAGITDLPFRQVALRFGAGLVVSEMVASRDMVTARPGTRARAALGLGAARSSVQLAGRKARWMAEAARMLQGEGAVIIDINMGCPAKKVTGGLSGAALMRAPDHALRLIEAVVGAVDVPVTLKMRLGWDEATLNAPDLARRAEAAGVRMIAVHGRTRCQFYRGRADWTAIRTVARAVRVPVVVNGDICTVAEARAALAASGAAAIMVGRGARGAPWVLGEIAAALTAEGRAVPTGTAPLRRSAPRPRGADLAALVAEHLEATCAFYGAELGGRVIRKHLGWYMDRAGTGHALRRQVLTASGPAAVLRLLPDALGTERRAA